MSRCANWCGMHEVEVRIRIAFKTEEQAAEGTRFLSAQLEEMDAELTGGPLKNPGLSGAEDYEWEITRRSL